MLKIKIQPTENLFETSFLITYKNEFLPRQKGSGFFSAMDPVQAKNMTRALIKKQTIFLLNSLVSERRFVYTQYWRPKTADEIRVQTFYIKTINDIQRAADNLPSKPFSEVCRVIIDLCNTKLQTIIPRPDKAKHQDIKNKVDALKKCYLLTVPALDKIGAEALEIDF